MLTFLATDISNWSRRRSAQLKSDNIQGLTASILSSVPFKIPEDEHELRRILKELASHIRTLEKELAMLHTPRSSALGTPESTSSLVEEATSSDNQSDQDDLSEPLKQLRFSQSSERYTLSKRLTLIKTGIGANPNAQIYKRAVFWEIQPWQITYEPQLPPLVFPPQDLLTHLLDLWFEKAHPYFPLFHRPTFENAVLSGLHYHDRHFGETLLAVCALSSRQSNDPRVFMHGSRLSAGFTWMQQVNPVPFSFTEAPSLPQVQKLILYIMFMYTTSIPYPSLTLTGLGIRLLQDVGAHRKKNSLPTVSRELWKRAFWMLNFIDLSFSVNIGRPRAMSPDELVGQLLMSEACLRPNLYSYDVEFPIECDDEFWEQPGDLAFKQPPGQLCQLTHWIQMLKLVSILESVQRALNSVRRSALMKKSTPDASHRRQQFILELDKTLNDWLEGIPAHLKWDPQCHDMVLFHQSTMLYIMYFFLRMEIHRSGLATSPSSLEICVNAAHSCVLIMEAHFKRDFMSLGPQMLGTISTSGIVLLTGIWRAKRLGMEINTELEMVDVVKSSELDNANTQQLNWETPDAMDISHGDWAEYMESVDEVLRSLQPP
ncbi:fungal-specific transcription factor domain-containing protein [Lentinula raphanica]|nr:fungal-specific transcription factor domain-containing protein [Lentinula raphanica]